MDILRKRVTRVGSGAFSIYLPKKWIDSWSPAQQEDREVDLRRIGHSLLVTPAIVERTYAATIATDAQGVCMRLLSAYVRGATKATLSPEEEFDNDCLIAARDFMRHLDERLVATVRPTQIGFELDPTIQGPAAPSADLLHILGAKVREIIDLAADAVHTYGHDPDRTLHTIRMLRSIHDEDVSRLFHQVVRMVATLELPLTSVSEYQFLSLAAAEMHQMSNNAVGIANTILDAYGLAPEDLAYPRQALLDRIQHVPRMSGIAGELVRSFRGPFKDTKQVLDELLEAFSTRDVDALANLLDRPAALQNDLQALVVEAVVSHWGREADPAEAVSAHNASKIASPLANIMDSVRMIAHHAVTLLAAEERS